MKLFSDERTCQGVAKAPRNKRTNKRQWPQKWFLSCVMSRIVSMLNDKKGILLACLTRPRYLVVNYTLPYLLMEMENNLWKYHRQHRTTYTMDGQTDRQTGCLPASRTGGILWIPEGCLLYEKIGDSMYGIWVKLYLWAKCHLLHNTLKMFHMILCDWLCCKYVANPPKTS